MESSTVPNGGNGRINEVVHSVCPFFLFRLMRLSATIMNSAEIKQTYDNAGFEFERMQSSPAQVSIARETWLEPCHNKSVKVSNV